MARKRKPPTPTFAIKGGPQLLAALRKLDKGMSDEILRTAVQKAAEVLAEEWRSRVTSTIALGPGSAHYVEAIQARSRKGRQGATAIVSLKKVRTEPGEAQPGVYAPRLEFGSGRTNKVMLKTGLIEPGRARVAQPTLRPAYDATKDRMIETMTGELQRLIRAAT